MSLFVQMMSLWPFSSQPRDFSQPNSSWSPEMRKVYDHYIALCDTDSENGEKQRGPWRKLPSYNRSIKYATGKWLVCICVVTSSHCYQWNGVIMQCKSQMSQCFCPIAGIHLSKLIQAKARLFTRNVKEQGATFEYVVFVNKEEKRCVCVFQAGHLLEGAPG